AFEPQRLSLGGAAQTMRLVESRAEMSAATERLPSAPAKPESDAVAVGSLADIAALAEANRDLAFKVQFKRSVRLVSIEPGRLSVNLTEDAPKTLLGDLTSRLQQWTGRRWIVSLSNEPGSKTLAEE